MADSISKAALQALALGMHANPFGVLGVHRENGTRKVRTFQPGSSSVDLLAIAKDDCWPMERVHPDGIFEREMPAGLRAYQFRIHREDGGSELLQDAYRFPSTLGDLDLHLLGEGAHEHMFTKLGAHCMRHRGVAGTCFSVWAPNATRVSVIGDFNDWDGRRHVMRLHPGNGIWEIFIPGVEPGAHYKFEMLDREKKLLPFKSDPVGQFHEAPPGNASIVFNSRYRWRDTEWMQARSMTPRLDQAVSIYELHLGSWRRGADNSLLGYRELASQLIPYVLDMGFTHVEFMPVTEHPFDGSWGYQPIGLFAPTQRFGSPDDFRYLVDRLHQAGIAVIVDWVPAHFPRDEHGLQNFDGTALYEHSDPRKGEHADWGTLIFNYGRREVINYLIGSALYWIREFHIDALRVDAVASMLYLDYSRKEGEWLPNELGGNENLEAVAFLKKLNTVVHREGATCYAEESTAWPGVSHPLEAGGLGFTYKWNMGWMNDTLAYMKEDAVHRKFHHDKMTFGPVYAFTENFVLPLSHDEVVHGKGSLLGRMPGDEWQRFANLRAYFGFMFGHPGKKLLFMGGEFAQSSEWNHDLSLDWHLLEHAPHKGVQSLMRDLNRVYRTTAALHELDFSDQGFEWVDWNDRDNSIFIWLRFSASGEFVLCVSNFTPVERENFRVGVPWAGEYTVLFNSDQGEYGGGGTENARHLKSQQLPCHGRSDSLEFKLPALCTLYFQPARQGTTGNRSQKN
jgi:1,4-alpha-glucan branching enzyme